MQRSSPGQPLAFFPTPAQIARMLGKCRINVVTGCWEWKGYTNEDGYGIISINGKSYRVHRVSFEVFVAQLRPEEDVHHQCRQRNCFNPAHLSAEDAREHAEESSLYRWLECELCGGPYEGSTRHINPAEPEAEIVINDKDGTHRYEYTETGYVYAGVIRAKSRSWAKRKWPSQLTGIRRSKTFVHAHLFGIEGYKQAQETPGSHQRSQPPARARTSVVRKAAPKRTGVRTASGSAAPATSQEIAE